MEIVFAGICCWIDAKPPKSGKTVIIPNTTRGGTHSGSNIPPHSAFIHAKRGQVESSDWAPTLMAGDDNLVYMFEGDFLTFDPVPSGGSIDITELPHVKAAVTNQPICPFADEIRPGFRDDPDPVKVLGLVELPGDAPVSTSANGRGAMFANLHMPKGPVTIKATPFTGGPSRSLQVIDGSASIFVCNVSIMDYLLGNLVREDDHKYLVCEMFRPRSIRNADDSPKQQDGELAVARLSSEEEQPGPPDHASLSRLNLASGKVMHDFLCTFAAGCSDSQWP